MTHEERQYRAVEAERDNLRLITEDWQRFSDSAWLREFLASKARWSYDTFGPGARTTGIIAHIRKELAEIEAQPFDLMEWIDVLMLAMDGFWRAYIASIGGAGVMTPEEWEGFDQTDAEFAADEFIALLCKKDRINRAREWPAPTSEDEPMEHVRPAFEEEDYDDG